MQRAIVFINGALQGKDKFYHQYINSQDFIACADGGANYTYQLNIQPDLILGDLDSLKQKYKKYYQQQKVTFLEYPAQKDKTDTQLLLEYLIKEEYTEIIVFAALGNRIDHALANIYLLEELDLAGVELKFVTPQESLELITDKKIISSQKGKTISLLPITSQVTGVYLSGFKYELKDGTFQRGSTLGVSNLIYSNRAEIKVETGKLLMIITSVD